LGLLSPLTARGRWRWFGAADQLDGGPVVPGWLARAVRPQAASGGASEVVWTLSLTAVLAVILATDLVAPNRIGAGALVVLPVLAAGWALGSRGLVFVTAVTALLEVVGVAAGQLSALMVAGRVVTIVLVAMVGRAAAIGYAEVRRARQREVGLLLRSSRLMARSLDHHGVAAEAVRVAAGTLVTAGRQGVRRAVLVRVAGERLVVLASHDDTGTTTRSGYPVPMRLLPPSIRAILATGRPAVVPTADLSPEQRAMAYATGAAAWAVARVDVGGEPFGLLAAASAEIDGLRRDDLRLLDGIARVTGLAIGAALQHAELAELEQRLQRSVEMALDVNRTLEPSLVIHTILVRVSEGLGADEATLARFDGDELVVESTLRDEHGHRLAPVQRRFPREAAARVSQLGGALATGEAVASGPFSGADGAADLVAALPGGEHTLTVPYGVGSRAPCLLALGRDGGRPFEDADLAQLEPMADVALLALRNAHAHAEARRAESAANTASDRLKRAIEAAEEIGTGRELSEVVERVLRGAVAVVGADRGSVSRVEDGEMVLEHQHDTSGIREQPGLRWVLSHSQMAASAVEGRVPLIASVPDRPDTEAAQWMRDAGLRHVIFCPLLVEDEVVGLLGLSRRRDEPFAEADLQSLRPFATLAGLLVRNARLLAEARQVGQARSAFLNLAAHELRTPLTVIRGYLSMLEDGTYPVPVRTREEAVDTLVAKAQELETLVEALVVAARLEGGTLPRDAGALDVAQAVRDAAERIRPRARLEGAAIELRLPDRPVAATADGGHVARILDNLLNNALTYSQQPACVVLELRAGDPVEVAVRDSGLGIPADQHELVFERFHRVEGATQRPGAGLGLGLSISRELAELNDGALLLESSVPDRGSVFVLRLPARA
jgi:signal transduction histidine kinase